MHRIPESELILNPDGSIYHLHLRPEHIADTIITVGDPDRVEMVSSHFDSIEHRIQKREFVTHTGHLNNRRLTVISTGIGTDNIDIVLNELDALVNIDLEERTIKPVHKSLEIVRLGTSGALQADVELDSLLVSTHSFGLDGLLCYYEGEYWIEQQYMIDAFKQHIAGRFRSIEPYMGSGSEDLIERIGEGMQRGITVSCSGFYAPQGRQLRLTPAFPDMLDNFREFSYQGNRITNFEMETAGIYGLCNVLGHQCCSVNAIIANRANNTFSKEPKKTVERMIELALERISLNSPIQS